MAPLTLVVGSKNYSSWSLRPYLALAHTGQPFEEVVIALDAPDTAANIARHSPSGKVPALRHGELTVWDSLAICEYVAELFPQAGLWPKDAAARAVARSVSAEMHSGFLALRQNCPMNIRARKPGVGLQAPGVAQDIARIQQLWRECRTRYGAGGPFLFGAFSIADAMYAPVLHRFVTYGVALDAQLSAYRDAVLQLPSMQAWTKASLAEPPVGKYE
ncbi:glutathione S-transferase family protein [Aggregicoccus sp. 17bor-14]|uniref:glutathione S-transferase family protein n=1 Tax=Myxococcaceae TaxID=31 RepID=UPI00129C8A33|nr:MULTISPECIES: glutathione S-transferase family protein [Myxococcaceae]MBF5043003.1 glutathione S-transferase family protein [Simulacricoccus sp. 17bor-14]MRI88768.1 glutathione S-transferase family protein [Aggregicoccus sp. 17bor-14]